MTPSDLSHARSSHNVRNAPRLVDPSPLVMIHHVESLAWVSCAEGKGARQTRWLVPRAAPRPKQNHALGM
eukprot:496481-Pyramimonas_sp.AAC.1